MPFSLNKKNVLIVVSITFIVIVIGVFILTKNTRNIESVPVQEIVKAPKQITHSVIGSSVEGRSIEAYTYGNGNIHLLFVGGIHGGYEWNSTLLAYQVMDYLENNLETIPQDISVSIIPTANPDGLYKVIGKEGRFTASDVQEEGPVGLGRFNAHDVDLNRNFACKWQPKSTWRGNVVGAGSKAFSEPETIAIRDFVLGNNTKAAIFWHSQSNAVYASECEYGVLPNTVTLMDTYADAADYKAVASFDAYEITGDAEGWLASIGIPAITVELSTHKTVEWDKNKAGVKSLLELYSNI